jgi:glycosyltransferase involved in cell wall biosynthesis
MQNKNFGISIILSIFKSDKNIKKNINSILNQSYKKWELIIIDDGSDLETKIVLSKFQKKDKRIKIITNHKNLGLAKSLNKGIQAAKFNYIARIDIDDYCLKKRLEIQIDYLKRNHKIDILGAGALYLINKKYKIVYMPELNFQIISMLRKTNPIIHPTVMMKKKVLLKLKGYDENFKKCQDYDLWIRASKKFKFYNIQKPLIIYSKKKVDLQTIYYTFKVLSKNQSKKKISTYFYLFKNLFLMLFFFITFRK